MEEYLEHHGILGMKWGIRRFQNPDGSLTPAGEERYKKYKNLSVDSAYWSKQTRNAFNDAHEYMSQTKFGKAAEEDPSGYKTYSQMLFADDQTYRNLVDKAMATEAFSKKIDAMKDEEYQELIRLGNEYTKQLLEEIDNESISRYKNM